jgi:uncharacterized membrane protein
VLGGFLALLSAATFALNNTSVRRGVLTGSVIQAMAITVTIGVPISFLVALATGALSVLAEFSTKSLAILAMTGVIHFVWGRYCNYRATKALGTNLVGPLQQVNLVITLALAIWILGEVLTPLRILGIALVLLGPSVTFRKKNKAPPAEQTVSDEIAAIETNKPATFVPNYVEGYIFGLLSATGYGVSPILVRIGLEGKGLVASIAGNFIASLSATAMMALILLWPGNIRHVLQLKLEPAKWFTFSGVLVCFSQIFLYMAMSIAPVTVVSTISRLSILFRLYFSRMINPHHEQFGGGVAVATVVSLLGAVILSFSTDVVLANVPLPDALVSILQWQWP